MPKAQNLGITRNEFMMRQLLAAAILLISVQSMHAEKRGDYSDISRGLVGSSVVSKIVLGRMGVPAGLSADYPVVTLVDPITGQNSYRVEWAYVRARAALITKKFDVGTRLRVDKVEVKNDRLELRLEGYDGGAKVKVMLPAGWADKTDLASVKQYLSTFLEFEATDDSAAGNFRAQVSSSVSAVPVHTYERPADAPSIPGRLATQQVNDTLRDIAAERGRVLAELLTQAMTVSKTLRSCQSSYFPAQK
jgi:hypothetical protein